MDTSHVGNLFSHGQSDLRNMSTFILAAFLPRPSSNSTDEANLASPTNHILVANPKLKVSHQKNEVELLKCHNTAQI